MRARAGLKPAPTSDVRFLRRRLLVDALFDKHRCECYRPSGGRRLKEACLSSTATETPPARRHRACASVEQVTGQAIEASLSGNVTPFVRLISLSKHGKETTVIEAT